MFAWFISPSCLLDVRCSDVIKCENDRNAPLYSTSAKIFLRLKTILSLVHGEHTVHCTVRSIVGISCY